MQKGTRVGRPAKYPPTPLGRLIASSRLSIAAAPLPSWLPRSAKQEIQSRRGATLARSELAEIAGTLFRELWKEPGPDRWRIEETLIGERDVASLESGNGTVSSAKTYWLLRAAMLDHDQATTVLEDQSFVKGSFAISSGNGHLIPFGFREAVARSEFGPLLNKGVVFANHRSTWVDVVRSGDGGFRAHELDLVVSRTPNCIKPDDELFTKIAASIAEEWRFRRTKKQKSSDDNPTIALFSVTTGRTAEDERPTLGALFKKSRYRFNQVAKGPHGLPFRWLALSRWDDPCEPIPHLASGIGVAVNVVCIRDRKVVMGRRKDVNFRANEYDVGAVEGIRPTANVDEKNGRIDIHGVILRALDEELGMKRSDEVLGRSSDDIVKQVAVFEFGVDLKYYQYNFLCFAVLDLSYDDILRLWSHAVDKHENKELVPLSYDRAAAQDFVAENYIWSSGIASLMGTFRVLGDRL